MSQSRADVVSTVLIVDDQEWTSRSVESILGPRGFAVAKAYTGQQALELAGRTEPDLCIVDFTLPDMDGIDVVRELRNRTILAPVTPLLMMSSGRVGRAARLEALGAGAWDILRHPLDPGELLLKVENLIHSKHEADALRREMITEARTGLYNVRGVLRRAKEMGADSLRFGRTMACIAVGPAWRSEGLGGESPGAHEPALGDLVPGAANAVRSAVREYDAVGQMGPFEFVVVASGIDQMGASRLADRILDHLAHAPFVEDLRRDPGELPLKAGVYVTPQPGSVDPEQLLRSATLALRRAQAGNGDFKVQSFEA